MSRRSLHVAVVLVAGMAFLAGTASAQDGSWTAPRTAFGHPDLQGVWANNNATPLQRPEVLGEREVLTEEELAAIQSRAEELFALDAGDAAFGDSVFTAALNEVESFSSRDTATGNYNQFWMVERDFDNRTSLITDPPNGRLPARTAAATMRAETASMKRQRHAVWTDDRSLGERCVSFGAPRLGAGYNSYYQLFQTPDHVVILMEMAHDARIIPLDGRPHLDGDVRQWLGDSRGYWDGDTLVVETKNYSPFASFMGAAEHLHITERFTPGERRRVAVRGHRQRSDHLGAAVDGHDSRCAAAPTPSTSTPATKATSAWKASSPARGTRRRRKRRKRPAADPAADRRLRHGRRPIQASERRPFFFHHAGAVPCPLTPWVALRAPEQSRAILALDVWTRRGGHP